MATPMMMRAERVMEEAEAASLFLRTLLGEGWDVQHAIPMTNAFIISRAQHHYGPKPDMPWDDLDDWQRGGD